MAFPMTVLLVFLHSISAPVYLADILCALLITPLIAWIRPRNSPSPDGILLFGLPVALLLQPHCPAVCLLAVALHLTEYLSTEHALRRSGNGREKNFALIAAYRATLAHCRNFPDEPHPAENPLFQPARNAIHALKTLIPAAVLLFGFALNAAGLHLPESDSVRWLLAALSLACLILNGNRLLPKGLSFRSARMFLAARLLPSIILAFVLTFVLAVFTPPSGSAVALPIAALAMCCSPNTDLSLF